MDPTSPTGDKLGAGADYPSVEMVTSDGHVILVREQQQNAPIGSQYQVPEGTATGTGSGTGIGTSEEHHIHPPVQIHLEGQRLSMEQAYAQRMSMDQGSWQPPRTSVSVSAASHVSIPPSPYHDHDQSPSPPPYPGVDGNGNGSGDGGVGVGVSVGLNGESSLPLALAQSPSGSAYPSSQMLSVSPTFAQSPSQGEAQLQLQAVPSPNHAQHVDEKAEQWRTKERGEMSPDEKKKGCCSNPGNRVGGMLFFLFAVALVIIFEVVKALFNLSLIKNSVKDYFVNIDYEAAKQKIKDALNVTRVPELVAIYDAFDSVFERFDVITQIGLEWNCGGAQSMISPIILFFGAVLLIVILQKDIFFKWAMTVRGSTVDTNIFVKKMRHAYASLLSVIMLYALQSSIVVIIKIVGSVWNVRRTCSPFDASLVVYGRVVCIVFIVVLFYTAVLVFAGVRTINFYALTFGWVNGVRYLIYLTFGQWTNSSISRFDIIARAKKFDNDDTDDDNGQETTMRLLGQSRGLIWMAFPAGVILTKCCEITNHPPLFIWGSRTIGKLPVDFKIRTPVQYRAVLWFLNVVRYVALFLGVMTGLPYCALVYIGGTVLFVVIELSLPESKPLPFEELPQEYQDSIIAQLKKQGADEDVEELLAKAQAYKIKMAAAQIAYQDRYTAKPQPQQYS